LRFSGPKTSIICTPMTSLKTSIKTITYLSDTGCLEIQGASLDLYSHRWEIELGYREIKQTMQLSRLTLRSKKPELVEQELWGV
ncbi:transposase, partial [Shigella dysenteriae]|uniref:transposase n=1 Tax=Shigella dysenteriae TaxID=622 RepID=UPI001F12163B